VWLTKTPGKSGPAFSFVAASGKDMWRSLSV